MILTLKAAGIKDLASFKWLEAPDTQRLKDALRLLTDLGALDAHQAMTSLGKQMLAFLIHPLRKNAACSTGAGMRLSSSSGCGSDSGRDLLIRWTVHSRTSRRALGRSIGFRPFSADAGLELCQPEQVPAQCVQGFGYSRSISPHRKAIARALPSNCQERGIGY